MSTPQSYQGPKPSAWYVERQALTRTPATPTIPGAGGVPLRTSNQSAGQVDPGAGNPTPGDGLIMANLMAITLSIYPGVVNGGGTFLGGGSLLCWIFNPYVGAWTRCDDLDIDLSSTNGYPAYTKSVFKLPSRLGMSINWLASGVTCTTTDFLLRLDGFNSVLGMGS